MKVSLLTAFLISLLISFSGNAQQLKIESNTKLMDSGVVYSVDLQNRSIVIGDAVRSLSRSLVVHDSAGPATDFAIQPDRQVRFRLNQNAALQGDLVIEEIWVMDK